MMYGKSFLILFLKTLWCMANLMVSYCLLYGQLVNVGDDVLLFFNDKTPFKSLVELMRNESHRMDQGSQLLYHIQLVQLLACCTEGKNVYTEIKCHSLLPLDDIVRVVTHDDCLPEVSNALLALGQEAEWVLSSVPLSICLSVWR